MPLQFFHTHYHLATPIYYLPYLAYGSPCYTFAILLPCPCLFCLLEGRSSSWNCAPPPHTCRPPPHLLPFTCLHPARHTTHYTLPHCTHTGPHTPPAGGRTTGPSCRTYAHTPTFHRLTLSHYITFGLHAFTLRRVAAGRAHLLPMLRHALPLTSPLMTLPGLQTRRYAVCAYRTHSHLHTYPIRGAISLHLTPSGERAVARGFTRYRAVDTAAATAATGEHGYTAPARGRCLPTVGPVGTGVLAVSYRDLYSSQEGGRCRRKG